jgi:hypothetical protein
LKGPKHRNKDKRKKKWKSMENKGEKEA